MALFSTISTNVSPAIRYTDRHIIIYGVIILTVLGTFLGTYHTLEDLISSPIILKKLLFNSGITLLGWLLVKYVILYFDKVYRWEDNIRWHRWTWQILATECLGVGVFLLGLGIRTWFIPEWRYVPKTVWLTDFPLLGIFVLLVNFVYYYLYSQQAIRQRIKSHVIPATLESVTVTKGRKTVLLPVQDIAYAFRSDDCNFVVNINNERFLLNSSLSKLQTQLPNENFYRLNRQTIAHRQAISSYTVQANRQLAVELTPSMLSQTQINKNRIADFRRWVKEEA